MFGLQSKHMQQIDRQTDIILFFLIFWIHGTSKRIYLNKTANRIHLPCSILSIFVQYVIELQLSYLPIKNFNCCFFNIYSLQRILIFFLQTLCSYKAFKFLYLQTLSPYKAFNFFPFKTYLSFCLAFYILILKPYFTTKPLDSVFQTLSSYKEF